MISNFLQEDSRTKMERAYNEVEKLFEFKSKGYSMPSIRSLIARKEDNSLSTMYFDVVQILNGTKSQEEVVQKYLDKAVALNIL